MINPLQWSSTDVLTKGPSPQSSNLSYSLIMQLHLARKILMMHVLNSVGSKIITLAKKNAISVARTTNILAEIDQQTLPQNSKTIGLYLVLQTVEGF